MQLPVDLAVPERSDSVPTGAGWSYEPKYDGWRASAGPRAIFSRHETNLTARFPELIAAVAELGEVVLDGEIVAETSGVLEFAALQASPRVRDDRGVAVYYLAFDLLAEDDRDQRGWPYWQRRERLAALLPDPPGRVQLVPATTSRDEALGWLEPGWAEVGIEGVVAKPVQSPYRARRSGWVIVRAMHSTEAAVLGVTDSAVVLGLPTTEGGWTAVGLSQPLIAALRAELAETLHATGEPTTLPPVIAGLPGQADPIPYQPTTVDTVVEIAVDAAIEHGRWRHNPRVCRIRSDLTAEDLAPID